MGLGFFGCVDGVLEALAGVCGLGVEGMLNDCATLGGKGVAIDEPAQSSPENARSPSNPRW